jgi:preprotein translocase subunit SecY
MSISLVHTYRDGISVVFFSPWLFYAIAIPGMVAGSMFVVWLANQISKFGIGQGVSVIIFANIISNSASSFKRVYNLYQTGSLHTDQLIAVILFFLALFFLVIYVEACNVFLPVRYTGVVGKNVEQKLPLKINNAGVMPAVLSSSFAHAPMMFAGLLEKMNFQTATLNKYAAYLSQSNPLYFVITSFLIFIFTISQSEISFDPQEVSQNLQESGAVIKNVRPGHNTYQLLKSILNRLNLIAGVFLIFVCVLSEYFCTHINQSVGEKVIQFGGTSVLILVSTSKLIFGGIKQYNYEAITGKMMIL